mmetsp:Transcript_35595/g.48496  ORF Transcript_35595/g.48496 Transcript_35595/m.48496 type:complete len:117 (+) Transcript_35595:243-593(+)
MNSSACNTSTIMQELECLEPERFKRAGDPLWAWLAINGISGLILMGFVCVCAFCGIQFVRSSRELRQFRAPLQEEVMELSETSLGVASTALSTRTSGRSSRRPGDQASAASYESMK